MNKLISNLKNRSRIVPKKTLEIISQVELASYLRLHIIYSLIFAGISFPEWQGGKIKAINVCVGISVLY